MLKRCILSDFLQICSNDGGLEPVVAQLALPVHQHRHLGAVTPLELGIRVDINDCDVKTDEALQIAQGLEHFVAKMTIAAAVDGQRRGTLSWHRSGTARKGSSSRAGLSAPRPGPCRTAPSSG